MDVRTATTEKFNGLPQVVGAFVNGQLFFLKEGGGPFLTVINNLARLFQPVDVVRAEGNEDHTGRSLKPLDSMEHGGGVIHRAVGVDRSTELVFDEALSDAIGKARAHEEHLLERLYLEARLRYIDDRSKFHF